MYQQLALRQHFARILQQQCQQFEFRRRQMQCFAVSAYWRLPVMLFRTDRARFYSYLHRVWLKTSDQPVWMAQSEAAAGDFF
ncbi:DUF2517 family protein [Symbiopectobacterium sp.]|uniref:DUF2517 family protein n=1 Tax=Symbiopectobacterium sp. TaxID=2952789 RepID=UPI003F30B43D